MLGAAAVPATAAVASPAADHVPVCWNCPYGDHLQHLMIFSSQLPQELWCILPAQVTGNQRGRNASQLNLAGTGIGSFNDRLRDAVLGGSPFAPSRCLLI